LTARRVDCREMPRYVASAMVERARFGPRQVMIADSCGPTLDCLVRATAAAEQAAAANHQAGARLVSQPPMPEAGKLSVSRTRQAGIALLPVSAHLPKCVTEGRFFAARLTLIRRGLNRPS
jgi:hypothetical protein